MDFRQLGGFVAVARGGTLVGAAHALDLAPSSLSAQIRNLEAALGVTLFERTPDGMRLTPHGRLLLERAEPLLDHVEAVRREVSGHRPPIRIGALETLAATELPTVLERLAERRPDLAVATTSVMRAPLLEEVADGRLDLGLLVDVGPVLGALGFGPVPEGLDFADIDDVPLVLAAAPGHPWAGDGGRADALAEHRLLVTNHGCSFRYASDRFDPAIPRTEVGSVTVARAWAARGLGVALLPLYAVADDVAAGRLVSFAPPREAPETVLRMVWRRGAEAGQDVREVLYATAAR